MAVAAEHNEAAGIVRLKLAKIDRRVEEESISEFVGRAALAQTRNASLRGLDGEFGPIGYFSIAQFIRVGTLIYLLSSRGAEETVPRGFLVRELRGPGD